MTTAPAVVDVVAPLSGVIVPLESVPDPAFARKMVGDGVAVDPTSAEVLAPIAGRVTQFHDARHAFAITDDHGLEILVHVGLDTVALAGRGFTPLVERGARVERGQPVLRLDLETIARSARSLLTELVVTSGDRVASQAAGLAEAGRTVLVRVERKAPAVAGAPASGEGPTVLSEPVVLSNRDGLHARPAAVLAAAAKEFSSEVRLVRGDDEANARSVVAILGLSTRAGDVLRLKAVGPDAAAAIPRLAALLAAGCGEEAGWAPPPPVAPTAPAAPIRGLPLAHRELAGAPASPGMVIGRVFQYPRAAIAVQELGGTPDEERARLDAGVREAARQLDALKRNAADATRAQLLDVQLALLEDPDLLAPAEELLAAGKSAAFAWREAFTRQAARLEALDNPLLRQRAADLRDVGGRLLGLLAEVELARVEVPADSVLVADELTPSQTASFDKTRVLGFCTTSGGSTSHVAILARSLGIPAVCGIEEAVLALPNGTRVVLDGTRGFLRVSPDEAQLERAKERIARQAARHEDDQAAALRLGSTRDGHRVEVVANVRNLEDVREAMAAGAEGVGLLRTEFLFSGRNAAPGEDEQAAAYAAMAQAIGGERPFVIRTLDVGGDKPLSYLPLPAEPNPFLGMRGIRVSLEYPHLFRAQLRAILRAAPHGNVHVMFPMVATLDEVRAAKGFLAEEQAHLPHAVKVGVMIEVPSAAVIAEVLAREVDFFSIGTNDLTQYTLAMDRGHPRLARQADALHPAVLRMMALTAEGAHEHGKWVGLCGGLAADPLAVPVLVGLGIDELSVPVPALGSVKAMLSRWTLRDCTTIATEALRLRTVGEVRAFLVEQVEGGESHPAERAMP